MRQQVSVQFDAGDPEHHVSTHHLQRVEGLNCVQSSVSLALGRSTGVYLGAMQPGWQAMAGFACAVERALIAVVSGKY